MLYLDEVFLSLQGESTDTGLPCIFVRLYGCPIGCSYCDQPQTIKNKHKASIATVVNKVKRYKEIPRVCITGGEPLIYKDEVLSLVWELQYEGFTVSIETSGCLPIDKDVYRRSYKYIMDVKCPSSGVVHKNIYENLLKLNSRDEVVFVIADRKDYDFMKHTLKTYHTSAQILLSPMFDKNNKNVIGKELADWVLKDKLNCRIQIQLHKILGVK